MAQELMKIDGRCHCGQITYRAEIDPDHVVICHCTDCQTFSGAPYRVSVFRVPPERVHLDGTPKTYVKTADSGNEVVVAFCGNCGTALYSTAARAPKGFNLRLGPIAQRAELIPRAQGFCRSAMPWATDISGIRRIPDPPIPAGR